MVNMKELLSLFWIFAKIGSMTFGGGYAMLPFLQRELIEKRNWVTEEEVADYFAIGQCTPGIIAVNTATFVGYKRKGVPGAILATLGIVFPSIVIITIIAAFISNFSDLPVVKNAFAGVRACVCVLVLNAIIKLWKSSIRNKISFILYAIIFLAAVLTNISTVILVIIAGIAGLVIGTIRKEKAQ
jgi:chromate transporter